MDSLPGRQLIDAYRAEAAYFRRDGKIAAAERLERLADKMLQAQVLATARRNNEN